MANLGSFRGLLFLLSGLDTSYADSLVLVLRVKGGSLGTRPDSVGTGTVFTDRCVNRCESPDCLKPGSVVSQAQL